MTVRKMGDVRDDGFIFVNYEKYRGRFREKWLSPQSFARMKAYQKKYQKAYVHPKTKSRQKVHGSLRAGGS